jgi:osmotically-inducible protein OsmY
MKTIAYLAVACATALALTACAPALVVGTGAVVTRAVVQERSTMDALQDTEIKISLSNALANHSGELYRDVGIDVVEGRVLLVGSVPRREDKVAAARIAWETENVVAVEDELTVAEDSSAKAYLVDVRISNTLRLKMLGDTKISSANYNVETINRVVHLTGLAKSRAELDRVIVKAQGIGGVERVVSHVLTIDDPRRVRAAAADGAVPGAAADDASGITTDPLPAATAG